MVDEALTTRPRLVLFRWAKKGLAPFLAQHLDAQTRTLNYFFDVKVIDEDCDYGQVCDEFEPDITVFESGVYSGTRRITNTAARPDIPRLGFLHSDAYDMSRAVFLADMDRWGVDQFFTTSVVMAEYTPEIADRLFVWPNAIDPQVFRDYSLPKNIPVLFTGSQERHYPWRNAVSNVLNQRFTTMTMPHFGWGGGTDRMITGEEYARLINASTFVPACGSMAGEVVRKQLEIPGSMACLVTERTSGLEAFGFRDMVNCVFADAGDVLDKLEHLNANAGLLQSITRAGFDLVHSRHTESHRSQVLDWLRIQKAAGPGTAVFQENPCNPPIPAQGPGYRATGTAGTMEQPKRPRDNDRTILGQGWQLFRQRQYDAAEHEFLRCLNYYFIPEAITGLVFTALSKGDSDAALDWVNQALVELLEERHAPDPDPTLWACHVRALLCAGEPRKAYGHAYRYPELHNAELDRIRLVLGALYPGREVAGMALSRPRPSIAPVPFQDFSTWFSELVAMLQACGCHGLAENVQRGFGLQATPETSEAVPRTTRRTQGRVGRRLMRNLRLRTKTGAVQRVRMALSPYKRRLTSDDWSALVTNVVRRADIHEAIVLGNNHDGRLSPIRDGLRMNPRRPELCAVSVGESPQRPASASRKTLLVVNFADGGHPGGQHASINRWLTDDDFASALVIIHGTARREEWKLLAQLADSGRYTLIAHQNTRKQSRAILRRTEHGHRLQEQVQEA